MKNLENDVDKNIDNIFQFENGDNFLNEDAINEILEEQEEKDKIIFQNIEDKLNPQKKYSLKTT